MTSEKEAESLAESVESELSETDLSEPQEPTDCRSRRRDELPFWSFGGGRTVEIPKSE